MIVTVTIENRFEGTPDGRVWTSSQFPYPFWGRYLEVFDEVRVLARVHEIPEGAANLKRSDGDAVSFVRIPYYVGPSEYLRVFRRVTQATRQAYRTDSAYIFRVPSLIANLLQPALSRNNHPYGVEVVSDPYHVFSPGAIKHPLRPYFRWSSVYRLKKHCRRAMAATYVTANALQERYPPAPTAFGTYYSDVELSDEDYVSQPRIYNSDERRLRLIIVGSLSHYNKGVDVLIEALSINVKDGLDLELIVVGDGKHRPDFEELANGLNLGDRVKFIGELPSAKAVAEQLKLADVFVLPSRHEGLPRAMVEAMAKALPCIGSTIGGIPELISKEDLVPSNDVKALAARIREVVLDPDRMTQMSARNLENAQEYREEVLRKRRLEFYQYIRTHTEAWLNEDHH